MLAGRKPLAVFADGKGCFPDAMVRYLRLFDRHIREGRIVRRDHFTGPSEVQPYTLHRIYFAVPTEAWRIDAMIELKEKDWSRDHERREGELLGYEDWMNDHFLALFYPVATGS